LKQGLASHSNILLKNEVNDFISENLHEEDAIIQREIKKRKMTMLSLGTFYILLLIVSFTLLS